MKIAVIGANNVLGQMIVKEAENISISVTSIVDSPLNLVGNGPVIIEDIDDIKDSVLKEFHYIIDTVSFNAINSIIDETCVFKLIRKLKNSNTKIITIAPCSILYTNKSKKEYVAECKDICDYLDIEKKELALKCFKLLKHKKETKWILISSPLNLDFEGYSTGLFEIHDDILPFSLNGLSTITLGDFAKAIVHIIKKNVDTFKVYSALGVKH